MNWQPASDLKIIQQRAALYRQIREFFAARGVQEVETPCLNVAAAPEPMIESMTTHYDGPGGSRVYYLQSSPELYMKRLLAAGSGAIFQIARAFRNGEQGAWHHPEFSLLEWYRPGFSHWDLMTETDALLQNVLNTPTGEQLQYADVLQNATGLHPLQTPTAALQSYVARHWQITDLSRDACLNLIFSQAIEPHLGHERPTFVHSYPASQAALARLLLESPEYAARFEVFVNGIELANGFYELSDAQEQRRRFMQENAARHALDLPPVPLDEAFLAALTAGLPDCGGIALGLDRLLMLQTGANRIEDVLTFALF